MPAPQEILKLVSRFSDNYDSYRAPTYNEAQTRQEFIDPFFGELGWDVANSKGYAEAYKEVIHEDSIKVGDSTKAPDYSFRIGGVRKFFLEAKAPSVNLKQDISPAYQVRRYGWSAKLSLSVLTDFHEFAVYDCRIRPEKSDKASTARTFYLTFEDYETRWDEIASIFSREAILKGSFDKYAESNKTKRGTAEVDTAFLNDIEGWRSDLARNLALRNPQLSQRELNTAVQKTIDRIVFLRICEDRGIELYGRLQSLLNGTKVYARLCELFRDADTKYNSGLFHFHKERERHEPPDEWSLGLEVDDAILKAMIRKLYYPESPYEFSVLGADILGQVYEQFLGKVIRLTKGHRAVVEDKPEVKKAGGVYYTPTYIVDYIVENTVGTLLEGKSPHEVSGRTEKWNRSASLHPLTVLDPACGSGSFLIGAYQHLLDWYLRWYSENDPDRWLKGKAPKIYETPRKDNSETRNFRLTTDERKRILLDHIYGVDIDQQAVEVTKLSLLLKVLEGETKETVQRQLFAKERALPDLANNIKCGNSLIGPDFYQGKQLDLFDEDERLRINVFDWHAEFAEIFKTGGFDAVIGNPPYVRQESLTLIKEYLHNHYQSYASSADLFVYFMEKAVKVLCDGGYFAFIVSSSFLRATYAESLRSYLAHSAPASRIVDFGGLPIFANAKDTYVCIPVLHKGESPQDVEICRVDSKPIESLENNVSTREYAIPRSRLMARAWSTRSESESALFHKITAAGKPLREFVDHRIFTGIKTGFNRAFELSAAESQHIIEKCPSSAPLIKRFIGGLEIRRYHLQSKDRYLIVLPSGWTRKQMSLDHKDASHAKESQAWQWLSEQHSLVAEHLLPFQEPCRLRQDQGDYWWELRACAYYDSLASPKIIYPDITKGPRFYRDVSGVFLANTAYLLGDDDPYLLGVLNSKLFWFSIGNISIPFGTRAGKYRYRLIYQYMEHVPICDVPSTDIQRWSIRDRIGTLALQTQVLNEKCESIKTAHERTSIQRQIIATDAEIDRLVYELYGLTDHEIRIVEEATNPPA